MGSGFLTNPWVILGLPVALTIFCWNKKGIQVHLMVDQETSSASLRIAFWKSQGIFLKGLKSSPLTFNPYYEAAQHLHANLIQSTCLIYFRIRSTKINTFQTLKLPSISKFAEVYVVGFVLVVTADKLYQHPESIQQHAWRTPHQRNYSGLSGSSGISARFGLSLR